MTSVFIVRQAALQSHCDISNMNRQWGINSQLNTSECCPTCKSIDGLKTAITESSQCITIPSQLSVERLINQIPADESNDH